jgi:hypothetical protein
MGHLTEKIGKKKKKNPLMDYHHQCFLFLLGKFPLKIAIAIRISK